MMRLFRFILCVLMPACGVAWVMASSAARKPRPSLSSSPSALSQSSSAGSAGSPVITLDGEEIRNEITPLNNNILVKVKDTLTATTGGILLPDQSKERPTEGLVLAVGPGKLHPHTGVRITCPIETGMSVLYGKFDGKPVEYKGEECQMIRDDNVLLAYTGVSMRLDTVEPIRDYVLIELDGEGGSGDEPVATSSGVVIAASVLKDNIPCKGKVVKIGEGRMASDGSLTKSPVQPGDYVKFKDYAGNDVMIEGKPYSVVKMVDILCSFSEKQQDEND